MESQNISQGPHNSSMNPPLERHVRELQALYEIGQALSSVHDLDHLLQLAMERVVTLLDIESASSILLDEERDELYFKVAYDRRAGHEQDLREVRFPAKQGIAGWVIQEGQSLVVSDVEQDSRWYSRVDAHTGTKTRSIICAPLRTKNRIIGVLEAINKIQGVFAIEDVQLLEAFANQLALALENARLIQELQAARERLSEENRYWREAMAQMVQFETLVGESPTMQEVYRLVQRVLNTTSNVLLTGESGTGKDLIAGVLHYQGPRAKGPFIAVNCAAIPETLLEAELFGYERGAYTGATQRKPGRFELATGGTLFLNEIGDMSAVLQAKLLQVLQDQQFERLGGRRPSRPTPALLRQPIKIWNSSSPRGDSARTYSTASTSTLSLYPRCESARRIWARSPCFSSRALAKSYARRCWASPRKPWGCSSATLGRATSGSWRTSWSVR